MKLEPVRYTRNKWPPRAPERMEDLRFMLRKCAEEPRTSAELAEHMLCVSMTRVYDYAKHLCAYGLLERLPRRNPGDHRVIYATTPLGRRWLGLATINAEVV